jgi:hypothetical protein
MGWKQIPPKPPLPSGGQGAQASELAGGQRGPPISPKEQGRWVAPPALIMPHAVRNVSGEGITRAITTVYYRAGQSGNHRFSAAVS